MKLKLRGKQIRAIGYPAGPVISVAMHEICTNFKHNSEEEALHILKDILAAPEKYLADEKLGKIAEKLIPQKENINEEIQLRIIPEGTSLIGALKALPLGEGLGGAVFGAEYIEEGALHQMYHAAKLPVAVAGALMPDAHHGYGLPIGGVLATENAVIPYGVGVDIGCRICLSIFDLDVKDLMQREAFFTRELNEATLFGSGAQFQSRQGGTDDAVMEDKAFDELPLLRQLHGRAWKQLGSSGSGNHFVEFGIVEVDEKDATLNVPAGKYIGLLSHSGSRGLGANIANHYTRIAMDKRRLPQEAKHLSWLMMDEAEGIEYWLAMNLAGDYASACHHVIHAKIAKQLGRKPVTMVENHHNFAWKEMYNGREVIVHRKGATPAGKDVLGIIPGSMTAPGFIVKGKGEEASINSAAHGAGRRMSRTQAMANITHNALKEELARHNVKLLGGGLDEAPFAYKDIEVVMQSQKQLVEVLGKFTPKIVKMCGAETNRIRKPSKREAIDGE